MMNPIDLEIYWNRLIAITDEAGAALKRTSFSTVVRESNDFACVLLDTEARLVAQSSLSIPGFIGTAPLSLQGMLKVFPKAGLIINNSRAKRRCKVIDGQQNCVREISKKTGSVRMYWKATENSHIQGKRRSVCPALQNVSE